MLPVSETKKIITCEVKFSVLTKGVGVRMFVDGYLCMWVGIYVCGWAYMYVGGYMFVGGLLCMSVGIYVCGEASVCGWLYNVYGWLSMYVSRYLIYVCGWVSFFDDNFRTINACTDQHPV